MRVFYSQHSVEHSELARLTQTDYDREMAILAVAPGPDGQEDTLGIAPAVADPDNICAEFGVIIRSDLKDTGSGAVLMQKPISTLRDHDTQRLVATVLAENQCMLKLARNLGFVKTRPGPADGTLECGTHTIQLLLKPEDQR